MFGIDDVVGLVSDIGGKLIDRLWPDPQQAAQAKLEMFKMVQSGELAQLAATTDLAKAQSATNTAEAQNTNVFVSGWRPFVGWICGFGLGMMFIVRPLAMFGANLAAHPVDFPVLDLGTLTTLLFGMLGLGAMRTVEKINGVASK